jgi:hypothetical protein
VSELERAAGAERFSVRGMAGYRSLARHANVSLDKVMQHAANGTVRALIPLEKRGRTPGARSSRPGTLDPKQALLVLWAKRDPQ